MSSQNRTEKLHFQAEVTNVLDIVIHSLYTNREIFVRELISNASDALEKLRQVSLTEKEIADKEIPYEITVEVDEKNKTFTISDTGIGMTRDEIVQNLGTIAHSGSKEFLSKLAEAAKKDVNLIGKFGVGFYSAFMVAKKVTIETRSYQQNATGQEWSCDGSQEYTIAEKDGLRRGTKITLELKDSEEEYSHPERVKEIIRKYSNFVPFDVKVGGEKVNTIQAIWTKNKNEIKEEEYTEFYKFIANSVDEPQFNFHFSTDAPLQINSLLFVPKSNLESFGFHRYESGIELHCRRVLIEKHVKWILPEWMRFVYGVIDSEDLPLNISRETLQDSNQVKKLGKIITSKFIKFLEEQHKKAPEKFEEFYKNFNKFIKEGIYTDFSNRHDLSKILCFESSKTEPSKLTTLTEYISRMKEKQTDIYFINGPTREDIMAGPYYEAFKSRDIEVIFTHDAIDDLGLTTLGEFDGKKIVSGDSADINFSDFEEIEKDKSESGTALDKDASDNLCAWLKNSLSEKVNEVRVSARLSENPALLVNDNKGMTGSMEKLMQLMNKDFAMINKRTLEINPKHPLIVKLASLKEKNEEIAKLIAEQLLDNATITAGLMTEPRSMISRLNKILEKAAE